MKRRVSFCASLVAGMATGAAAAWGNGLATLYGLVVCGALIALRGFEAWTDTE